MKIVLKDLRVATPAMSVEIRNEAKLNQIARLLEKHLLKTYSIVCEVDVDD